jgi:heat shock protein HslJ
MLPHLLRSLPLALLVFVTLSACAMAPDPGPAVALTALPDGTRWQLQAASIDALQVPEASEVTLNVDAQRIHGNSGCNQYSAGYRFEAGGFVLDPVAATKRGCLGPGGTIEQAFFAALRQVQGFAREGDALVMRLADGGRLVFHPVTPATE